eukprot:GFKZ01002846.1.p1 GENE.GFKZ01002846.1~~GFKZ01002846.1.p1  ORF type:complete len:384 (-),score=109.55 GFKZ01002846.1:1703-2854(-)
MVDARRKKERRRDPPKPTEKLTPFDPPADRAVAIKQRNFCKNIINQLLDDESSLSFSQPVRELWDMSQLHDYFEKIKEPMDLGTIKNTLNNPNGFVNSSTDLFDPNAFRRDVRLVFLNAMDFNSKGTDLYRLAHRFISFIDKEMVDLPGRAAADDPPPAPADQNPGKQDNPAKDDKPQTQPPNQTEKPPKPPQMTQNHDDDIVEDKSDKADDDVDHDDDDKKDDDVSADDAKHDHPDEDANKLNRQIAALEKQRKIAEASLAEMELMRNVPLTHDESIKLRDEVEALPWETSKKVVKILQKYVDEALLDSKESDPEFVLLEFSTVEPRLLRDIEELIRPNPNVEKEKNTIANLNEEISTLHKKLKRKSERDMGSVKKKPRRRR